MDNIWILVIGDRVWGKGLTLEAALMKASKPKKYVAYLIHKDMWVDEMGDICYPHGTRDHTPREIIRKGVPKKKVKKAEKDTSK